MSDTYTVLAHVYTQAGFTIETEALRVRLFNKIQADGWLGRRILELGSGVGETSAWFGEHGYRITAVDYSEAMLREAQERASQKGAHVDFRQQDMRSLDVGNSYELVLCLNTLNEMRTLRDLEAVFRGVNQALAAGKTFVFDLLTIRALAELWGNRDSVLLDDEDLMVMVRSRYSHETASNTRAYIVFERTSEEAWQRLDETHILRGYALQAVAPILQRTGFKVENVLDPTFQVFDPYQDQTGQAIFITTKERDLA